MHALERVATLWDDGRAVAEGAARFGDRKTEARKAPFVRFFHARKFMAGRVGSPAGLPVPLFRFANPARPATLLARGGGLEATEETKP